MKRFLVLFVMTTLPSVSWASNNLTVVTTQNSGSVRNFNPFNSFNSFDVAIGSFYAQDFIYEPLLVFNVWHSDHDFPRLATSFEIGKDLKTVTYTLRDNDHWSDGESFTAEDVVFTFQYAKSHPENKVNIAHFKICRNPYYYQDSQLKVDCLKIPLQRGTDELLAFARLKKRLVRSKSTGLGSRLRIAFRA